MYTLSELESKTFGELKKIGDELNVLPAGDRRRRQSWIEAIAGVNPPLLQLLETFPAEDIQAQDLPIIKTVEPFPAGEVEQAQDAIEVQAQDAISQVAKASPGAEVDRVQEPIVPEAKNLYSSRSKTSTAHQLLELFKSSAHIIEDSPGVKTEPKVSQSAIEQVAKTFSPGVDPFEPKCSECFDDRYIEDEFGCVMVCHCNCDPTLSRQKTQSAIAPAAKISESDLNPILTGIPLSDKFLARYTPPQPRNIRFQVEADGQLSLVDFEVLTEPEPPDPDDFESLEAFREAIARWDWEHPSSSVHCEPSSVHCEPNTNFLKFCYR